MSATCQDPSIDAIHTSPLRSWPGYQLKGNSVTVAFLKIKAFVYTFRTKSAQPTRGLGDDEDPPQTAELEDYWNDPMLWMLMFH
jgi:hypothetical protein